ncbi:hypothetical protein [Halodesulfovibrio spirochaetisodalis]|uniref:Uncharacterized protein n=1 Tax=Halodesulfovibrio spirochaetisodalis TaxID=1560234 RepID=A0A1B7XMR4_9BACT|nr:hypothetical protein [Halodesulfovibrio spirochaetisodalis]OBQ56789.1 hypothetical protein SP90_01550 [Halodesulfovibrio spirochaetisodalis]
MFDQQFENLMECATQLADNPKYLDAITAHYITGDKCQLDIKIDDPVWDYMKDSLSIDTVCLMQALYKDLTHLFNLDSVNKYTPEELKKEFNSQLDFAYHEGCIQINADLSGIVNVMFDGYKDLLSANSSRWNCAVSGSLFALAIVTLGTEDWYSLKKLQVLKRENASNNNITKALGYAHKILMGSRGTPDFLVKTLSKGGVVSVNGEKPKTASQLKALKYKDTVVDEYHIDDRFKLEAFSSNFVTAPVAGKSRRMSLKELEPDDVERMAQLAKKVVRTKRAVYQNLQVSVFFKGVEYAGAQVDGFGDKRSDAITAEELFSNPLYSFPVERRILKKKQKNKKDNDPNWLALPNTLPDSNEE